MKKDGVSLSSPFYKSIGVNRSKSTLRKNKIMTAETYHFHTGTEMPFKFQDDGLPVLADSKTFRTLTRHLEWREARRRFVEIAEKYDLDEYGLPRRGTW